MFPEVLIPTSPSVARRSKATERDAAAATGGISINIKFKDIVDINILPKLVDSAEELGISVHDSVESPEPRSESGIWVHDLSVPHGPALNSV